MPVRRQEEARWASQLAACALVAAVACELAACSHTLLLLHSTPPPLALLLRTAKRLRQRVSEFVLLYFVLVKQVAPLRRCMLALVLLLHMAKQL
jgi:hypothetical protein